MNGVIVHYIVHTAWNGSVLIGNDVRFSFNLIPSKLTLYVCSFRSMHYLLPNYLP